MVRRVNSLLVARELGQARKTHRGAAASMRAHHRGIGAGGQLLTF
jgi:hypothetical protein